MIIGRGIFWDFEMPNWEFFDSPAAESPPLACSCGFLATYAKVSKNHDLCHPPHATQRLYLSCYRQSAPLNACSK